MFVCNDISQEIATTARSVIDSFDRVLTDSEQDKIEAASRAFVLKVDELKQGGNESIGKDQVADIVHAHCHGFDMPLITRTISYMFALRPD